MQELRNLTNNPIWIYYLRKYNSNTKKCFQKNENDKNKKKKVVSEYEQGGVKEAENN